MPVLTVVSPLYVFTPVSIQVLVLLFVNFNTLGVASAEFRIVPLMMLLLAVPSRTRVSVPVLPLPACWTFPTTVIGAVDGLKVAVYVVAAACKVGETLLIWRR